MIALGLGTNMGDREENLFCAIRRLDAYQGIAVKAVSSIYETAPFGVIDQPDFLNMTVNVATEMPPLVLLKACLQVEQEMGRVRTRRWGPRIIDIDILFYNDMVLNTPELTLPHPGISQRGFVILPLREIAPDFLLSDGRRVAEAAKNFASEKNAVRLLKSVRWDPALRSLV